MATGQRDDDHAVRQRLELRAERLDRGAELRRERLQALPRAVDDRRLLFALGVRVRRDGDDADEALLAARDDVGVGARLARDERADGVERAERGELGGDDAAVGRALHRIAREHAREEVVERGGDVLADVAHARRRLEEHLREDRDLVVAGERGQAGEALEEDGAEREDVGARVELLRAARLLGRHVAERAEHDAGVRDRARAEAHARDAEVDERGAIEVAVAEEQVARLDVAMDDPLRVRDGERLGDARDHLHALAHREAGAREALAERLADDPLHREVRHAVVGLAVGDVLDDARVAQLLEDARLAVEALLVLAGVTPVEDLDATTPPRRRSFARKTADIPPALTRRSISKRCAMVVPGSITARGRS